MSGCQEALLLTRQPTPAVPLQEVSLALHLTCLQVLTLTTCCLFKLAVVTHTLLRDTCCYLLTYAIDLQACTQEFCPARALSAHCSLSHLENISEEHLQSNCQQPTCSQGQRQSSTEEQAPVFPKEKFPEEISYVSPALRRQSLQGSCSLPTVFSGQLV